VYFNLKVFREEIGRQNSELNVFPTVTYKIPCVFDETVLHRQYICMVVA